MRLAYAWVGLVIMVFTPAVVQAHTLNPKVIEFITNEPFSYDDHHHDDDQTDTGDPRVSSRRFYVIPEWYIVYHAQEYGDMMKAGNRPSQFPYFSATAQIWETWRLAEEAAKEAPDPVTNTILWTIAISATVENTVIGLYEGTTGRLFELLHFNHKTKEDYYIDSVAITYGEFLVHTPWYQFPYDQALKGLWSTWGWSSLSPRGMERRAIYTVGYGIKLAYAKAIGALSGSQLGSAALETTVRASDVFLDQVSTIPGTAVSSVEEVDGSISVLMTLPRYRAFLPALTELVATGAKIDDIQGNHSITLSYVAPLSAKCDQVEDHAVFSLPLVTNDSRARFFLDVPVADISTVLSGLQACGLPAEHFYDF